MEFMTIQDIMYDADGEIVGIRKETARSKAEAFRIAVGEQEYIVEDMPGQWIKDESEFRYDIGPLKERVSRIVVKTMRPARPDEYSDPFYEETWVWTTDIVHPEAVEYWDLTQV